MTKWLIRRNKNSNTENLDSNSRGISSDPEFPFSEEEQVSGGEAEGAQGKKRVHPVLGGVEYDDTQVLRRRPIRPHRCKLRTCTPLTS